MYWHGVQPVNEEQHCDMIPRSRADSRIYAERSGSGRHTISSFLKELGKVDSMKEVAMPKKAATHIQNKDTRPGRRWRWPCNA